MKSLDFQCNVVSHYLVPPKCGRLYDLGQLKRASVETLHLLPSFQSRRVSHQLICGELLVTNLFQMEEDGDRSACIYCSWREIQPNLIYISQQDPVHGSIIDVGSEFFDLVHHRLENSDFSVSSAEITESLGAPMSSCKDPLYAAAHNAAFVDASSAPEIEPNTIAYSPNDDIKECSNVSASHDKGFPTVLQQASSTEKGAEDEDEDADAFEELVISILQSMIATLPSVDFYRSDYRYDPSGSIADYRYEFSVLEDLFDEILTSFDCPHRNLDKELLMELISGWELSIETVRKFRVQKALSILDWLPAMWMQVIGCPAIVRSQEELLCILLDTVISLEDFTEATVVQELVKQSFRPKFAKWVAFHMVSSVEYLEEYLLDISEPLTLNSFLLESTIDGRSTVQYTHLHKRGNGSYAVVEPKVNLELKVAKSDVAVVKNVIPVTLSWTSQSWLPRDYAKQVFQYMQKQLHQQREDSLDINNYCFFGHVCSEDSVIGMSKY
eukprot:gene25421-33177_t